MYLDEQEWDNTKYKRNISYISEWFFQQADPTVRFPKHV